MAHLDFSHLDHGLRPLRSLFGVRLHRVQYMLLAAALASMTIVGVAAAMMTRL